MTTADGARQFEAFSEEAIRQRADALPALEIALSAIIHHIATQQAEAQLQTAIDVVQALKLRSP